MAQKLDDTQPMDPAGLWKRYGNTLLTVVLLILIAVIGWWKWQQYQNGKEIAADQAFKSLVMLTARQQPLNEQEMQQANTLAQQITTEHGDLLYADFARLIQANNAVKLGQFDTAIAALQAELAHGHDEFSKGRARIDLARLYNDRHQYNEALGLLGENIPQGLIPQMLEVRGDALKGLGRTSEAREAWQKALDQAKEQNAVMYGLKLKLNDLTAEENH